MQSIPANSRYPSARRNQTSACAMILFALGAAACGSNDNGTVNGQQPAVPSLSSTSPSDTSVGVPLNAKVSASFDLPMSPLGAATFTLKQGATVVAGTV